MCHRILQANKLIRNYCETLKLNQKGLSVTHLILILQNPTESDTNDE